MPPSLKVQAAYKAMSAIGIPEKKTKPVLKKLLQVYDKNWALIEEENYRALADAIFDYEDTATASAEQTKTPEIVNQGDSLNEEDEEQDERPLKRLRRGQGGQPSASSGSTNTDLHAIKEPQTLVDDGMASYDVAHGVQRLVDKGKRPMLSEGTEISRQVESSHPREITLGPLRLKEANEETGARSQRIKELDADSSLKSNEEPLDGTSAFEMPLAVIHPEDVVQLSAAACPSHHPQKHVGSSRPNGFNNQVDMRASKGAKNSHCLPITAGQSLGVIEKLEICSDDMRRLFDATDVTRGQEKVKVSLVGESMTELPTFHYISQSIIYNSARVKLYLARIGDKLCCPTCYDDCSLHTENCVCPHRNGGHFAYTPEGCLTDRFLENLMTELTGDTQKNRLFHCKACPLERYKNEGIMEPCKGHLERKFIKECWIKCGCSMNCLNRLMQRGITRKLQVFWTPEGKGWGLRTLEELPKGAFVCEFAGEILTVGELHQRSLQLSGSSKHSYAVPLDAGWDSCSLKEDQTLCLDATFFGNVARFINHRCLDANLIEVPVQVETPDRHYYHVALFTKRKIDAMEELTWDYRVDFDEGGSLFKPFCCLCGSSFCRNLKRSSSKKD